MLVCAEQRTCAVLTRANYNVQQKGKREFLKVYTQLWVECKPSITQPTISFCYVSVSNSYKEGTFCQTFLPPPIWVITYSHRCVNCGEGDTAKAKRTSTYEEIHCFTFVPNHSKNWPIHQIICYHTSKASYIMVRTWLICVFCYVSVGTARKARSAQKNTRSK